MKRRVGAILLSGALILCAKTAIDFKDPVDVFRLAVNQSRSLNSTSPQIIDRNGVPLTVSFKGEWNLDDAIPLHRIPEILQKAVVSAEDKRFFKHVGVDWRARLSAIWVNIKQRAGVRGASTITEQVVRMIHPRPRSLWSKWIEGFEAYALERFVSKSDILEFYLNQVPYASNRRGVVQAARHYFNRDLSTLHPKEYLALAVLIRAPSRLDLYKQRASPDESIGRLAHTMHASGTITDDIFKTVSASSIRTSKPQLAADSSHFVRFVRDNIGADSLGAKRFATTLDLQLQNDVTELLRTQLKTLAKKNLHHGAALVVDHRTNEILAWVSLGANCDETAGKGEGCAIDMVTVPRQPGSAMKPFLYAAALENGWTAATVIEDAPFSDQVGTGIHHFKNYSRSYYGKVTLRQALGNSLNIPAVHAINLVGPREYLKTLKKLEFKSLTQPAEFYDDGLALGNGEVTLFELVQGYQALAGKGNFRPLQFRLHDRVELVRQVYSEEAASLVGDILSDPWARSLEFGRHSALNLPVQTAVKTGTSTDFRDAWAVGYDYRHVVGVWMGNVDYKPTDGVTGSTGPAMALRAIMNRLKVGDETQPLYRSPKLIPQKVCVDSTCYEEYFTTAQLRLDQPKVELPKKIEIERPAAGLWLAVDPRIPKESQAFEMRLAGVSEESEVEWMIDGANVARAKGATYFWQPVRGKHRVSAFVYADGATVQTPERVFEVR